MSLRKKAMSCLFFCEQHFRYFHDIMSSLLMAQLLLLKQINKVDKLKMTRLCKLRPSTFLFMETVNMQMSLQWIMLIYLLRTDVYPMSAVIEAQKRICYCNCYYKYVDNVRTPTCIIVLYPTLELKWVVVCMPTYYFIRVVSRGHAFKSVCRIFLEVQVAFKACANDKRKTFHWAISSSLCFPWQKQMRKNWACEVLRNYTPFVLFSFSCICFFFQKKIEKKRRAIIDHVLWGFFCGWEKKPLRAGGMGVAAIVSSPFLFDFDWLRSPWLLQAIGQSVLPLQPCKDTISIRSRGIYGHKRP